MSKILVLGDICIDINYYGNVHKISPEAPIPIFSIESNKEIPGMSGNVVKNLEHAGNQVISYTKDNFDYSMTIKSRYFAGKHYLYRIDRDNIEILKEKEQDIVLSMITRIKDLKVVILQDYNKGFFTQQFIQDIITKIRLMNPKISIIADGHKSRDITFYDNVDYLKLNEEEFKTLLNDSDNRIGLMYVEKGIIKTMGDRGATLQRLDKPDYHIQYKVDNVIDVTGAGDTFVSWFASEIANRASEEEAMNMACRAASISVQYLGCYAPFKDTV